MYSRKKQKIIAVMAMIVLLLSMFVFPAAAVDNYESESNNTASTADQTYDDYNNYGVISTTSDVDMWQVTFSQSGIANFYLDPGAGCDLDLYIYDGGYMDNMDYEPIVASRKVTGYPELIRMRVYAGSKYYMKIVSFSGVSSVNYLLRTKWYALGDGKLFTIQYGETLATGKYRYTDTTEDANEILSKLWGVGYGAQNFLNNTSNAAYNVLPNTGIFYLKQHGNKGIITFYSSYTDSYSYLLGNYSGSASHVKGINQYSDGALANVDLILLVACHSGATDDTENNYGNLVDALLSKGARNCIGWIDSVDVEDSKIWCSYFFDELVRGSTIQKALAYADEMIGIIYSEDDQREQRDRIRNRYVGSSAIETTVLA